MAEPSSETPLDREDESVDAAGQDWSEATEEVSEAFDEESYADDEEYSDEYEYDSYADEDSYVEDESVEAKPVPTDETSAARYKFAIFMLLGVAGLLTLGAAVRFWLPPWAPLTVFGVFGVAPVVFWSFVGAFLFDPSKARDGVVTKDSPPLRTRLKMALAPVVAAGLLGALFAGLWYIAPVRSAIATVAASQRLTGTLDAALVDDSASVRLAACEGLAELKDDTSTRLLMALNDPDDAVAECALEAMPAYPEAPRELLLAANSWHGQLMSTEPLDGERACVLSNRMRLAERKGLSTAPMHLLDCALTSPSDPAAHCCAQSFRGLLGGQDVELPMVMRPPPELLHRGFVKTLPALLEATHSKDPKWEQRRQMLRLDTPVTKAWAMAVGCEALQYGGADRREHMSGVMAKAVSSDSCSIGPASETTVRLWTAVCSRVYSQEAVSAAEGNEDERFCRAISSTLQADATNEARRATQSAVRNAKSPGRRAKMMKALLNYGGRIAKAMQDGGNAFGGDMGDMEMDESGMFLMPKGVDQDEDDPSRAMFGNMMRMFMKAQQNPDGKAPTMEEFLMDEAARNFDDAGLDMDPRDLIEMPSD